MHSARTANRHYQTLDWNSSTSIKVVSPKMHGTMIALRRLMGFSKSSTSLMTGAGAAIPGMSMLTRYPMGLLRMLPMQAHLAADVAPDAVLSRDGKRFERLAY